MQKIFCSTKDKDVEYYTKYVDSSDLEKESREPLRKICMEKQSEDCNVSKCPLRH